MSLQTAIAIFVVLLCAALVLRSWIVFWIRLVQAPRETNTETSCSSCVNGCSRSKESVPLVELKRISIGKNEIRSL
jgi:hypothetical protein